MATFDEAKQQQEANRARTERVIEERAATKAKISADFDALTTKEKHALIFKKVKAAIPRAVSLDLDVKARTATVFVKAADLPVNASIAQRSHLEESKLTKLEATTFDLVNQNEIEPLLGAPLELTVLAEEARAANLA